MTEFARQAIVVGDETLRDELAAAFAGAGSGRSALRLARDPDEAELLLRQRAPELLVFELPHDAESLRRFVARARALAPQLVLVAAEPRAGDPPAPAPVLLEAVRSRIDDVLSRPISSGAVQNLLGLLAAREEAGADQRGRVVTFHSTKGGVGKSTLSINTAVGLALRHPDDVLLVDCSLQLGVCASALDLTPRHSVATAARERTRLDAHLLRDLSTRHERSGLRLLAAPADAVEAADVDAESLVQVIALARTTFRYVVVDTLPIVDAVMLAVFDLADRIHLVNQGTVPDVIGAARLRELLEQIEIPAARTRIVVNRTMAPFPEQLGLEEIGKRIGRPVDFEVPWERRVLAALNLGEPCVLSAGRRGWGGVIHSLVDDAESLGREADRASFASDDRSAATLPVETVRASSGLSGLGRRLFSFATGDRS